MSRDSSRESRGPAFSRRSFLGTAAVTAGSAVVGTGVAGADDEFSRVIDVVDAGVDNTGEEPITGDLEELVGDDTLLKFPDGEYLMDRQLRFTDFSNFAMVGADATVLRPAPADEYEGESRMFKLGTYYAPGQDLRIENFNVDFTADNTGLRVFQVQVSDGLELRDLYFGGQHDAGTWGPILADVVDPNGRGVAEDVEMLYGGAYTENTDQDADPTVKWGPTGFLLSPYHEGRIDLNNVRVGMFPDNGLYVSDGNGQVVVNGGYYRGSNVASIRIAGDDSAIRGATVEVNYNRPEDGTQRGIRLDEGSNLLVSDTEINLEDPNGAGIAVLNSVDSARIENSSITVQNRAEDAIDVRSGAGATEIVDTDITTERGGQALMLRSGDADAVVDGLTVTGDASGAYGGRCAVRCERDDTTFRNLDVDQPGEGYRRALGVHADNVTVSGGTFKASHHPIIQNGDDNVYKNLTAKSYDGYEAVKLLRGNVHVDVAGSTLYEGLYDQGTEDLDTWDNSYPGA